MDKLLNNKKLAQKHKESLSKLPPIEKRIVTMAANDYLNHYCLDPSDYDLVTTYSSTVGTNALSVAFKKMTDNMKKRSYLAVVNLQVQQVWFGDKSQSNIMLIGTAISPKWTS